MKVLDLLDGRKTNIGLIITGLTQVLTVVNEFVADGVVTPQRFTALISGLFLAVGAAHKLYKGE